MEAAFPSVEHEFFHEFFRKLGWPVWLLNIIRIFYLDNTCQIAFAGSRFCGFALTRGIRQGCPLSPLLFAMATDLMLRRLQRKFPSAISRAWADDLAMVIPAAVSQLRSLQNFFLDFGRVAGLHLNMDKTVVVPLHEYDENVVRDYLVREAPDWGGVSIAGAAKYLGYFLGPARESQSWTGPVSKYLERAKTWGKLGLGMLITLQAYQVYMCSVLQFVAQLEPLPENLLDKNRQAVQALFPGPTACIVPSCLKDARYLHLPIALMDMQAVATAAKVRALRCENLADGGLQVTMRAGRLLENCHGDCSLMHFHWCRTWAQNSFLFHLREADNDLRRKLRANPGADVILHKREGLQKRICNFCRTTDVGDACQHLRRRLDRWALSTLPGHRVLRAFKVLGVLQRMTSPRVQASYLRTICDG